MKGQHISKLINLQSLFLSKLILIDSNKIGAEGALHISKLINLQSLEFK